MQRAEAERGPIPSSSAQPDIIPLYFPLLYLTTLLYFFLFSGAPVDISVLSPVITYWGPFVTIILFSPLSPRSTPLGTLGKALQTRLAVFLCFSSHIIPNPRCCTPNYALTFLWTTILQDDGGEPTKTANLRNLIVVNWTLFTTQGTECITNIVCDRWSCTKYEDEYAKRGPKTCAESVEPIYHSPAGHAEEIGELTS